MWAHLLAPLALIASCVAVPAVKPQSIRGIIFPTIENDENCFLDALKTQRGVCRKLADCPQALERWKNENLRPETCYFNKFDQFVCCAEEAVPKTATPTIRRSQTECSSYYQIRTQVVHGETTTPGEFPFMAALGWNSNLPNQIHYRCGGVLVSNKFVLTAAHCAEMGGDAPVVVRLNGANLTDASVVDEKIRRIVVHPKYKASDSYNDIALVELEREVSLRPACLWHQQAVAHSNVTALGYGHTRFAGAASPHLLKAALNVVTPQECQRFFPPDAELLSNGVLDSQICAGDPDHLRDTCQGDSGGPIISAVEEEFRVSYVVGITSFGEGCAGQPPSIYTRVSAYVDWIEDNVWATS